MEQSYPAAVSGAVGVPDGSVRSARAVLAAKSRPPKTHDTNMLFISPTSNLPCSSAKQCSVSPRRCYSCASIACNESALGAAL